MEKQNPAESGDSSPPNEKGKKHDNILRFLKGFRDGKEEKPWKTVEKEFHKFVDEGKLSKEKFGACIGMDANSKGFADTLFDILAKRRRIEGGKGITLQQLKEFWENLMKDDDLHWAKQFIMLRILEGLIAGKKEEEWKKVEEEFHKQLDNGILSKDKFGACIGMNKDLAHKLFDILAKRRKIDVDEAAKGISVQQLKEFWEELMHDKQKQFILEVSIAGKEEEAWKIVEEEFYKQMDGGRLCKDKFGACIGMDENSKDFAEELFEVMAKRKKIEAAKGITLQQFKKFWKELENDDPDSMIDLFFDLCDKNDDNKISKEEVETVLKWTAHANKLTNIENEIASYASLIVEKFDPKDKQFIEIEHMKLFIKELWNPEEVKRRERQNVSGSSSLTEKIKTFIDENWERIWVLTLWLVINLSLFVWKFMENMKNEAFQVMGYCACVAKGSAETLKFNMGLILFLACRGTLTKLRSSFLSSIVPFDDHIFFHQLVGVAISFATVVHMIFHFGCGFPRLTSCPSNKLREILGPSFELNQQLSYSDLVASVPGVTGILMFIIMSFCFTLAFPLLRKSEKKQSKLRNSFQNLIGFNAFWYAHHLLFLVYVLMILHGYFISLAWDWLNRTTWMYIAIPILVYASERLLWRYEVRVKEAVPSTEETLVALKLVKPQGFEYKSGMYLHVNCPQVSYFEWHPFSITSAPGDKYISLHIGTKGDWKEKLLQQFQKEIKANRNESRSSVKYPQIYIRGPYGAPAQSYKQFEILLLIGLGVGATPMVSILKDVLNHIKTNALQSETAEANHTSVNSSLFKQHKLFSFLIPSKNSRATSRDITPKRVYFYWVTNTQESFEWFKGVMDDVAKYEDGVRTSLKQKRIPFQQQRIIEMHNHLSSVHEEGDARSLFLTILQNLLPTDLISRSRIRARYGRPHWENVFSKLQSTHPDSEIGVFYCGTPSPKIFRDLCKSNSNDQTKFHFHAENF